MKYAWAAACGLGAAVGCADPYVHVIVEGTDLELVVAPNDVNVSVYRGGKGASFSYTAPLETGRLGDLPATDFVLTGELSSTQPAQLRVTMETTKTWLAEATLDDATPGELRLPVSLGEGPVGTSLISLGAIGSDTSVLYGAGMVFAWVDSQGVQVQVEHDADMLIGRGKQVDPDRDAMGLRLASRPDPVGFGPDLYAVGWIASGTSQAKVRVTSSRIDHDVVSVHPGVSANELRIGAAFKNAPFGVAVGLREGNAIELITLKTTGEVIASALLSTSGPVEALAGIVVTIDGNIVVGWRGGDGSHLAQVAGDLSGGAMKLIDMPVADDLLALSLSPDAGRLLTVQRRSQRIADVGYFMSNLQATGVDVDLGPIATGGDASVSGCVISWPSLRDDGSGATDLRYAVLDGNGAVVHGSHLLNASATGDHIRPTTACASSTRAYATFVERSQPGDMAGHLKVRRIPAIDQ